MIGDHEPDDAYERFVPLTRAGDRWAAQLLVARLQSEGIVARLSGDSGGPYPVSVGGMATTQVWVPERMRDAAQAILDEAEEYAPDEAELQPAGIGVSANPLVSALWWLVAALLLAWILWVRIGRFL